MNVLLVYPDRESHQHWMNKRLMKRGGFQLEEFDVAYAWQDDLYAQLSKHKVAVAMGLQPLRVLMGAYQPFRWLGKFTTHATGCVVVGGFDPLRLLPNYVEDDDDDEDAGEERTRSPARLTAAVAMAIRKAQRINALPENPYLVETHYTYDPSPDEFSRWVDACLGAKPEYLSWDIETPYKAAKDEEDYEQPRLKEDQAVIRISFAYEVGKAVSIPWDAPYIPHIRRLFTSYSGWHVGWNSYSFDVPYLMEKGFTFGGKFLDGMDAWHWLQSDLDKGLEHVTGFFTDILPWKHLSKSEPAHYSCIDADAALRNTIAIVELIKESGSWDAYQTASVDLMVPHLYPAGRRGNFIDRASQETLRAELTEKLDDLLWEIQGVVPEEFKTYKQYTRQPTGEGWEPQEGVGEERVCSKCGKLNVNVKHPCVKSGEGQIEKRVISKTYWIQKSPPKGALRKWIKSNGFNPSSNDQLRRYIRAQGHPLGKNHKNKNADEAVDAKHLKRLARSYPDHKVYALIVSTHKVLKALSTYVEGLTPDETGRVYTTYRNNPSTWRLSSENINVQNQSKRADNPYAKKSRRTIVASSGHVLIQADSSAIEAVFVGYFMQDQQYIELARKSIHAYLVCKWRGWEWNDVNLKRAKADDFYDMMKRTVHSTNYGMGYRLLYNTYDETFKSMSDAKRCQEFLFAQLPTLEQWQHEIRVRAQKECYLQGPWGHRHYFYDVFSYRLSPTGKVMYGPTGRPLIRLGKDAKRAIAYLPQHSAGMFMRENLGIIGRSAFGKFMPANVSVHDGYVLDVPKALAGSAADFLSEVLTRPIPQMGNLRVGCEVEQGENWLELEKLRTVTV